LDIPVGLHTGLGPPNSPYQCCPKFRASLGNPLLLEEVLIRHPKLRLYVMHAGYPYLREMIALMYVYPQVYADVAVIDWILPREEFHDYLKGLMRAGMGKRLMFGSDQMVWPEAIGMAVENIESARFLTLAQKRDIFFNNAVRFFKLEDKQPRRTSLRRSAPSNNSFNASGDSVSFILFPSL
jgi:predicted TIM-barrel fold metal-dependent hydrolase